MKEGMQMKKAICLLLSAALGISLIGCAKPIPEDEQVVTEFTVETQAQESVPSSTLPEPMPTETIAQQELERIAAFQAVLQRFLNYTGPEGEEIPHLDDFGPIEENTFGIADVDGDGETELILNLRNMPMAGMITWVCGYDSETGTTYEKLAEFPAVEFYTGGLAELKWSHNQGLAGNSFWPYTLMGYNPSTRHYEAIAHVDAWDKNYSEINAEGKRFPDSIDTDGAGIVYLVTMNGNDSILSQSGYEQWRANLFGSAELIPVDYQYTNPQNIDALLAQ